MRSTKLTEAEALVAWIQAPLDERSPLSKKEQEQLERWNVTDNLLREHMSERAVIPMLVEKFQYSESSARRDIDCTRRVWGTRPRADKDYLANMLVDYLTETMVRAGTAKKFGEVARLAKVIIEAAGIGKKDEAPLDPQELRRKPIVEPQFDPALIGGTFMPEAERSELVKRMLQEKRAKGFIEQSTLVQLAESDEE